MVLRSAVHALEKEIATHSNVLAWRITGMGEPVGLSSMGSHRFGHNLSDLAAVAAVQESRRGEMISIGVVLRPTVAMGL